MGKDPFDGSDGVMPRQLAKEQGSEPSPGVHGACKLISIVTGDDGLELGSRNQLDYLFKNGRLRHGSQDPLGKDFLGRKPYLWLL